MTARWSESDERKLIDLTRRCEHLLARRADAVPVIESVVGLSAGEAADDHETKHSPRLAAPALLARAKRAYARTTKRRQLLGDKLFFNPAWNILLDLFISENDGKRVSVTAVCIGSQSSTGTALRYAAMLVDAGLVGRLADATDGRRSYMHLTEVGWRLMQELLTS